MATRPSFEDLLKDIPCEKLDYPCRDVHLSEIALSVTKWKSIAPYLGLTEAEEENIEKDCGENETQKIGMLRKHRYTRPRFFNWGLERLDMRLCLFAAKQMYLALCSSSVYMCVYLFVCLSPQCLNIASNMTSLTKVE